MSNFIVWHGTNQTFDTFDVAFLGLNNRNSSSIQAFFFSLGPQNAWDYAQQAARKLIPDQLAHERRVQELIKAAQAAERRKDFAASERLLQEAEDLETQALQAPPSGAQILRCEIEIDHPLEIDGSDRAVVTDLGRILREARGAGHDAVILRGIHDTPTGTPEPDDHIAVFDPGRISILDRYPSLEAALERDLEGPEA